MNNIPTAEEFFEQGGTYPELAIKFAQLHVQAALQTASKNIKVDIDEYGNVKGYKETMQKSILDAYPLENIK